MSKNQVALFEDELAKLAVDSVKAEQAGLGATFLSTKSGALTYRGNPITGNKLQCVILAAPVERLYYDTRYDPTKLVGPKCFAIAAIATGMGPTDRVEGKQHDTCEGCPKNEWGSATNGGKGKACRETRRLLLIPADSIGSVDAVKAAEVAALRPPVTSLKNYATYVQTVATTLKRPPLAVISEIAVVPDAKTQFKVTFSLIKAIDDPGIIRALMDRAETETQRAIETAGIASDEQAEGAPAAAAATSDKY
jgi:hypothetical protein